MKIDEMTFYQSFYNSASVNKKYTALVYQFKKFTYSHVLKKINTLACSLNKMGFKKDDVITVMLPNIPSSVYLLYAINQIGSIANLIHPLMQYEQLKEIMIKTNSKILFLLDSRINEFLKFNELGITLFTCSPAYELPFYKKIIYDRQNKIVKYKNRVEKLFTGDTYNYFDKEILKDSFYLHSGGTTGEAKTIALSNLSINSLSKNGLDILNISDGHGLGMLSILPVFHGFGLVMGVHVSLLFGAYDVLIPKFKSKIVIKYLKKNLLHNFIGVPILYEGLLANKNFKGKTIKGMLNAFVGGDFVSESLRNRFNDRMKEGSSSARLFEGYGLTETVTVCCVNTKKYNKDKTVGKPIEGIKIRAFSDDGKMLDYEKEGELYVSGPTLMNGYRFEKVKFNPFIVDEDGTKWVKTGDYGKVDTDGFVYFIQRLKRVVKVKGINIFPSMIENEIRNEPYIFDCYIKSIKDEKIGSLLALFVVIKRGYENNYDEQLTKLIISKFGIHAKPYKIIYIDKFPKTLIGKIDEKKLEIK